MNGEDHSEEHAQTWEYLATLVRRIEALESVLTDVKTRLGRLEGLRGRGVG